MSLEVQQISKETSVNKKRREALEAKRDNTSVAIPLTVQSTRKKSVDLSCDGKFSFSEAAKNFGKGFVSPVMGMLSSKESFFTGAALMAGCALLVVATGGAAAPFLVGAGVAMGAVQAGQGIAKIITAKNGDDIEKACYDFGGATGTIGLSVLGAKGSLKQAGVATEGLNPFSATVKCVTTLKSTAAESAMTFKTGYFKTNLQNAIKPLFQSRTFKSYAKQIYAEGQKNFDEAHREVYNMLPEEFRAGFQARPKGKISIYDKLIDECSANSQKIEKIKKDPNLTKAEKAEAINGLKADEIFYKNSKNFAKARAKVNDLIGTRLVLENPSLEQMEKLTVAIIDAIKNDDINITQIKKYHGPKTEGYFTKAQIKRIQEAGAEKDLNIRVLEEQDQIKPSGYCATQFKIIHKNGSLGEFQVRGKVVDAFAEGEHIPYDLRTGKDVAGGNNKIGALLAPFKKAINKLNENQYKEYEKYLSKNYCYARRVEKGLSPKEVKLPGYFDEILSNENLQAIHEQITKIPKKTQKSFMILPQTAVTYGSYQLAN